MQHVDAINRVSLFKTMEDREHLLIVPREPHDRFEPFKRDYLSPYVVDEIRHQLGADTVVAESVNGISGLWVGFSIDQDRYWLQTDRARFEQPTGATWLVWFLSAAALSLAGAAWIARLINRPLQDLSQATGRVQEGDFVASTLDERVGTHEIRAVNAGFNRMTQKLAKIEQDRAVMLAGISHDLRTPLARLRLEAELSVSDPQARDNMAKDIDQLDAIIAKFLDYARPGDMALHPVSLNEAVERCIESLRRHSDLEFRVALEKNLLVLADPVELQRVITNLLENASRYGKSVDTGTALIDVSARHQNKQVLLRIRDHGLGVPPDQLSQLTNPFFRGEAARTEANSTGLGLAIVERTLARMGGRLDLSNAESGGLCATVLLQRGV